ncbi:MAG: 3-oxoacyl-ACP synthase [Bacteroidia bacterium]|nr:MAG: 3-oxoacyl-ACP synthase [Bacteroidia bacterium]
MAYINGAANISPQNTLNYRQFIQGEVSQNNVFFQSINPDYKEFLTPIEARRMSQTVKQGIYCALTALKEAECKSPKAIITGTGLGILSDTEKFLENMLKNEEQFLTPTSFIQSTHNTVAAQIALKLKSHAYNFTYSQKGHSFESALLDALLQLDEKKSPVLVGGTDEITANFFKIFAQTGDWKTRKTSPENVLDANTNGAVRGEGTAFFVLSNKAQKHTYAKITALKCLYKPEKEKRQETLHKLLIESGLNHNDIDFILTGNSGDKRSDKLYQEFLAEEFSGQSSGCFKQLSGECQTATAFALWLGANIIKHNKVPDFICSSPKNKKSINNLLIYNHFFDINHTFILLSKPAID